MVEGMPVLKSTDNYHRDMNVFAKDITIEDDMSVLVKYNTGATMTYHLTAYSVCPLVSNLSGPAR